MAYVDAQVGQYMAQRIIDKVKVVSESNYDPEDVNPGDFRAVVLPTDFQLGDIIFWNGSSNKLEKHTVAEMQAEDFPAYDANNFVPIGVIAIPSSHDVYGTGEAMMLSLRVRSRENPDNGIVTGLAQGTTGGCILNTKTSPGGNLLLTVDKWAERGSLNFSALTYEISENEVSKSIVTAKYGYMGCILPTTDENGAELDENLPENFNGLVNTDTIAAYYHVNAPSTLIDDSQVYLYTPSPYAAYGSRNPLYFDSDPYLLLNQFNGKQLTINACNKLTIENWQDSSWVPSTADWAQRSFIATDPTNSYLAAACTWRFHTPGTSQGDWYCADISEMVYVNVRANILSSIYDSINAWAGDTIAVFVSPQSAAYAGAKSVSSDGWIIDLFSGRYGQLWAVTNANSNAAYPCWPMQAMRLKTLG